VFQNQTLLEIFFTFDFISGQKEVNMIFFEEFYLVRFCDEIIFKILRNLPENTNKEAT
jgi:hypothetical protein